MVVCGGLSWLLMARYETMGLLCFSKKNGVKIEQRNQGETAGSGDS